MYVGRFAPSPSGPLHFGSLVAAVASYLDARAAGGRWQLRIEDLDGSRVKRDAADVILRQLEGFGLWWDGKIVWQSERGALYWDALDLLGKHGLTYSCGCTRSEIADSALGLDGARIYPGTCRRGLPPGKRARTLRVRTEPALLRFTDRIQGALQQSVEAEVGDFVVLRADHTLAYQLAVVVDDAAQGVTDVVRGADLLDSTPRQMYLQHLLGYREPRYAHVPIALGATGIKLSKQNGADPIELAHARSELSAALSFLGHPPPAGLALGELLDWGRRNWDIGRIPRVRTRQYIG